MKIGTDVSLSVCKAEGYMIIEFDGRKPFTPKTEIRCIVYWPEYDHFAGELMLSDYWDAESLWEVYQDNKQGIDSFIGGSHEFPTDYHEFLHLASDTNQYVGLNNY